ncbi:uncharacterized protein MYCFIDRAFT_43063 [Pseudocercospora fijiensis CIRAD86]|uniref:Flavin reductase like domain-containing protein n=1 Tax=Pseudocercospora fijiensis (strain CIRAD86) TaxID=383855 RepID=M2ZT95_PSEFD|nr:uncharacterized protein MYCFIDRAFT_43063 [Pseudocercospora fijiensis CIRAD86]EME82234.1 hypothetical protein MYCFIDRAFT_43063 [Pseudocercospora fijiensis CIRAD86]
MVFYEPGKTPHGLPRDPFKSCVAPRPIGWISTRNTTSGIANLAPFSQFNNLTFDPPYVMFSANQDMNCNRKDTVINAESSGVFCWNMATYSLREAVNASAEWLKPEVDEFAKVGLEKMPAELIECPMVKESPIKFECRYHSTIRLPGNPPMGSVDIVIGRVIGVHISEHVITDGMVDLGKAMPIARCGYHQYVVVKGENLFDMVIPGDPKQLVGLEGNAEKHRVFVDGHGVEAGES